LVISKFFLLIFHLSSYSILASETTAKAGSRSKVLAERAVLPAARTVLTVVAA